VRRGLPRLAGADPMLAGLEPAELPADAVEVGRIGDAWGVQGWFKVISHSAHPEALFSSKRWYLLPTERGPQPFEGVALMAIREAKDHSGTVVARCQDVADRDAAQALKGSRIFVARSSFPTAGADEFYWVDLIGLSVVNREGLVLGLVRDLVSTGPQTVLVIENTQDDAVREILIPFVSVYVDAVDIAQRQIRVDWQPDY